MAVRELPPGAPIPAESRDPAWAADVLGCTDQHVRDLCRRGELVAVRKGRRWYIDADSVRRRAGRRAQGQLGGLYR